MGDFCRDSGKMPAVRPATPGRSTEHARGYLIQNAKCNKIIHWRISTGAKRLLARRQHENRKETRGVPRPTREPVQTTGPQPIRQSAQQHETGTQTHQIIRGVQQSSSSGQPFVRPVLRTGTRRAHRLTCTSPDVRENPSGGHPFVHTELSQHSVARKCEFLCTKTNTSRTNSVRTFRPALDTRVLYPQQGVACLATSLLAC